MTKGSSCTTADPGLVLHQFAGSPLSSRAPGHAGGMALTEHPPESQPFLACKPTIHVPDVGPQTD